MENHSSYAERVEYVVKKVAEHEEWANENKGQPVDFSNVIFSGVPLEGANLSSTSLKNCHTFSTKLSEIDFKDSDLSGSVMHDSICIETDFTRANVSDVFLNDSLFILAVLKDANFSKSMLDDSTWKVVAGERVNFNESCLRVSEFRSCDFRGGNFKEANLYASVFINVDFEGADMSVGFKQHASFIQCNLRNTNFSGSDLSYSSFYGSDLEGADFTGATLTGVVGNGREIKTVQTGEGMVTSIGTISFKAEHPNKQPIVTWEDIAIAEGEEYDFDF